MTRTEEVKTELATCGRIKLFGRKAMSFHLIWMWRATVFTSGVSRLLGLSNIKILLAILFILPVSLCTTLLVIMFWKYTKYQARITKENKFQREGMQSFFIASN